ncbi:MAG: hypothetical protein IBX68_00415 [Dehalococcoidia bacterium]|nr:hypothetical protein [Dehalococcoidia bacterium]
MRPDYFILVFIASIGVYQLGSLVAGLHGLCFYRDSRVQVLFGVLAILGAFGWFFTDENRNIQHTVEGSQQLGLFLLAIISAYVVTAILASMIEARVDAGANRPRTERQYKLGVETLKTRTLWGGILSSLRREKERETDDAAAI